MEFMEGLENQSRRLHSQEQDSSCIASLAETFSPTTRHILILTRSFIGIYAILLHFCHIPPLSPENGGCGSCCLMQLLSESKFHAVCLIWESLVTCLHSSCRSVQQESDPRFCLGEAALIVYSENMDLKLKTIKISYSHSLIITLDW